MPRSTIVATIVLAGIAASVAPGAKSWAAGPDPSTVYVQDLTYSGSGCPQGSVAKSGADDRLSWTLGFDLFGVSAPDGSARASCEIQITLKAPANWSWALASVEVHGYAQIPAKGLGRITASYVYPHTVNPAKYPPATMTIGGPFSQNYVMTAETPPMQVEWSECGGTNTLRLQVDAEVKVKNGEGLLDVQEIDGQIVQGDPDFGPGFHLVWRRCI